MRHLLILFLCGLLLSGCHKNKHDEPETKANLTVLVYIAGDNNLDGSYYDYEEQRTINFIDEDISQMIKGSSSLTKFQNLILFVDRRGFPPYFLKIADNDTTRLYTFPQELKSSDPATLQMAMKWVKDNYEANNYGLVLWGHAEGWTISSGRSTTARRAYGQDTTGGMTWMEIPDMAKALENFCGNSPLRFIFADCCCFQSIESAYELRHCTDYLIASPAEIPGEGAPYNTVIPALFSSSANFWQLAAEAYHAQTSYGYKEPLSVIKTDELENLAQATKAALTQSLEPMNSDHTNYPDVSGLIYYYNHCLYDINDFMLRNASSDVYAQWKRSYDKAVPYKAMTTVWMSGGYYYFETHVPYIDTAEAEFRDFEVTSERYGGVSMYVPQDVTTLSLSRDKSYQEKQRSTISQMQWYKAAGYDVIGW